jgi:hypothetical protein
LRWGGFSAKAAPPSQPSPASGGRSSYAVSIWIKVAPVRPSSKDDRAWRSCPPACGRRLGWGRFTAADDRSARLVSERSARCRACGSLFVARPTKSNRKEGRPKALRPPGILPCGFAPGGGSFRQYVHVLTKRWPTSCRPAFGLFPPPCAQRMGPLSRRAHPARKNGEPSQRPSSATLRLLAHGCAALKGAPCAAAVGGGQTRRAACRMHPFFVGTWMCRRKIPPPTANSEGRMPVGRGALGMSGGFREALLRARECQHTDVLAGKRRKDACSRRRFRSRGTSKRRHSPAAAGGTARRQRQRRLRIWAPITIPAGR